MSASIPLSATRVVVLYPERFDTGLYDIRSMVVAAYPEYRHADVVGSVQAAATDSGHVFFVVTLDISPDAR